MNTDEHELLGSDDWVETASRIHDTILRAACNNNVRVGFPASAAAKEAMQKLRKVGYRKPVFASAKDWVRHIVVNDKEAFLELAFNIQLEFIVDGCPKSWRAVGTLIDHELGAKMVELGRGEWFSKFAEPRRILLCFNLGSTFEPFKGLLATPHAIAVTPQETIPSELKIVIWDNFHYIDKSESRTLPGTWRNLADAVAECKQIVEQSLHDCYKPGMTADELYDQYRSVGDDPSIVGAGTDVPFSAWTYARERVANFIADRKNNEGSAC